MLNLVWLNLVLCTKLFAQFLLRGKGLELRSALQLRGNAEAKELPFISAFFFSLGEERGTTYGLLAATSKAK